MRTFVTQATGWLRPLPAARCTGGGDTFRRPEIIRSRNATTVRINSTTPTQSRNLRDCTKAPVIKSTTAMVATITNRILPAAASSRPQVHRGRKSRWPRPRCSTEHQMSWIPRARIPYTPLGEAHRSRRAPVLWSCAARACSVWRHPTSLFGARPDARSGCIRRVLQAGPDRCSDPVGKP